MKTKIEEKILQCRIERDIALFSLDKEKIIEYMKKWEPEALAIPLKDERIFWLGIYRAILQIEHCPPDVRAKVEKLEDDIWKEITHGAKKVPNKVFSRG